MTVTTVTATERRQQLQDLASSWDDTPQAERELALAASAHPSLHGWELVSAWSEYLDAHRVVEALETGAMGWADFEPELTCADRQDRAAEDAAMWAAGVLDTLVNGGN